MAKFVEELGLNSFCFAVKTGLQMPQHTVPPPCKETQALKYILGIALTSPYSLHSFISKPDRKEISLWLLCRV